MEAIVGDLPLIAADTTPDALASLLLSRVDDLDALRVRAVDRAEDFAYARAAAKPRSAVEG